MYLRHHRKAYNHSCERSNHETTKLRTGHALRVVVVGEDACFKISVPSSRSEDREHAHVPEEQHVRPLHPWPPHWPYSAAQLPEEGGVVVVVGGVVVVGLVVGAGVAPDFCILNTTTPFAGNVYEKELPFAIDTVPVTGVIVFGAVSVFEALAEPESDVV
jgi:hypothetical protein